MAALAASTAAAGETSRSTGAEPTHVRRVLLVTHYYAEHHGGVEMVAGELGRRLTDRRADHTIDWVATGPTTQGRPTAVNRRPARGWNGTEDRFGIPYPVWTPRSLWRLGTLVERNEVVHLHDSLYLGNVVAWLWARRHRRPVVVTQHIGVVPYRSVVARSLLRTANRLIAGPLLARSDEVVFISPRVRQSFAGPRATPLGRVVANGVDTARFTPLADTARAHLRTRLGWPAHRRTFLFVGRFVEKKGLPFMRELAKTRPQDHWVLVGRGPERPEAWELPNVDVLGPRSQAELVPLYQAADALVLPSLGEGFPLVVQEALACGTPAVVSDETLEGAPAVVPGLVGAPLEVGAWMSLLDSLAPMDERSRSARAAETACWNWDAVADRYLSLFDGAAARRRRSRTR